MGQSQATCVKVVYPPFILGDRFELLALMQQLAGKKNSYEPPVLPS